MPLTSAAWETRDDIAWLTGFWARRIYLMSALSTGYRPLDGRTCGSDSSAGVFHSLLECRPAFITELRRKCAAHPPSRRFPLVTGTSVHGMASKHASRLLTRNLWIVPRRDHLDKDLKCCLSNGTTAAPLGGLKPTGARPAPASNHALSRFEAPSVCLCCCFPHRDKCGQRPARLPEETWSCLFPWLSTSRTPACLPRNHCAAWSSHRRFQAIYSAASHLQVH